MARYVLLTFEDNNEADLFVKAVEEGNVIFQRAQVQDSLVYGPIQGAAVRGVFMKPTKFCDCKGYAGRSQRGAKWGLYVHAECGKPRPGNWQHPKNLYTPTVRPSQQPEGINVHEGREHLDEEALKKYSRDMYLGVVEPRPEDGKVPQPWTKDTNFGSTTRQR